MTKRINIKKCPASWLTGLTLLLVFAGGPLYAQKISADVKPFRIHVTDAAICDLKQRLAATRWPDSVVGSGWNYGTNPAYLRVLTHYWKTSFNWRAQEVRLNRLHHYVIMINGQRIHFVYERGRGRQSTPLVLLHGWPSTFVQMQAIIPLLTQPDAEGRSFDVIVPSLIGYGFSPGATQPAMTVDRMAALFQKLMTEKLGYDRFIVRASDIGAGVAKEWALAYPTHVLGLHLSGSNPYTFGVPSDLSETERAYLQKSGQFMQAEGAYAMEQSTKPQTLTYGLNDSPAGLAAWIIEKFRAWSDNGGQLERAFSRDELLTNISLYWFTQTIGSSMRAYYESAHVPSPHTGQRVTVPTAFMMLQHDIAVGPREWEARTYNIVRWHVHPAGGHFAEWEQPSLIAQDLQAFRNELGKP